MPTAHQKTAQGVTSPYFAGADVGASRTKVAVIDADVFMAGYGVDRSGTDFTATADRCLTQALAMADIGKDWIDRTISTGYGRKNVSYAHDHAPKSAATEKDVSTIFHLPSPLSISAVRIIRSLK